MDYFSKFLRPGNQPAPAKPVDHALEFHRSWQLVRHTLEYPDERQLLRGIRSTEVPAHLQSMVDALEGGTGACMEYILKNDVLGTLVRLSEADRPVLRAVQNMVVLLDEQLLRNCVGDDIQEQLDGRNKVMGAAKNAEYEEDLVNLLCILCSRIRTHRELLMIFFHDKHWYRSEPLFAKVAEEQAQRAGSPSPSQNTVKSTQASSLTKKPEYEFLLFNYLLRFVHREGQIGDFARAGLLFLMDVAMSPGERAAGDDKADPVSDAANALADYIIDGDFSEVLGAGLGAVYSLLPSKLEYRLLNTPDAGPGSGMMIGGTGPETDEEKQEVEEQRQRSRAMGVEDAYNPDFKVQLDHFLKLLEFLQDVLRRNIVHDADVASAMGPAIVQSIMDAVRRIFLENVVYPSVLECSDADGSAVAVMSYIEVMIRTLRDGQLGDLLVDFLMSEDNDDVVRRPRHQSTINLDAAPAPPQAASVDKTAKSRRRRSTAMALLEMEAPDARRQSEYPTAMARFTLKDLLLSNLRSKSQPTSTSALQLLQTMLTQHPQLCVDKLLIVTSDPRATSFPFPALDNSALATSPINDDDDDDPFNPSLRTDDLNTTMPSHHPMFFQPETTYSTHEREMGLYMTLISRVDPSHSGDAFSTGYDHYLRDALISIQTQPTYQLDLDEDVRRKMKHKLNVNDPIITLLLESLRKFFSNTPEYNMTLTGVLATLAHHPDRSLAGWLTFAHNKSSAGDKSESIEEDLEKDLVFLPASSVDDDSRPVVHTIFHGLVAQLERYRQLVDNFDRYLLERRQGLLFSENLSDALSLAFEMGGEQVIPIVQEPVRPKPAKKPTTSSSFVSFLQDLTPRKSRPQKPMLAAEPTTPPRRASPFGPHYRRTGAINVEPFVAPVPTSGPWTPSQSSTAWVPEDEDVFSSGWSEKTEPHASREEAEDVQEKTPTVTLSQLLDNVVILEESIKELVAIIHARRSLGIDTVRYL
ncbi:Retinoic acid induced 16-like protein-domain-containing protein [Schizophyllum amplum]|uniref:Retinoic acid induced 16-like protein-domain-containing protein n=1 Tax=Schizophyllum amplum TaxID=97359 RepID=A0A550BTH1_9AGAR|nr:Retinoic acid induced 16-like protein-domain-containing protein [Auriculariopsis ampla]